MRNTFNITYILFLILFITNPLHSSCGDDFEQIELNCIKKYKDNFQEVAIEIKSGELGTAGTAIFYLTEAKYLGKIIISQAEYNGKTCSITIEGMTYIGNELYSPNTTLNIKKEFGGWKNDFVALDNVGVRDFALTVKNRKCYLKTLEARAHVYKKIKGKAIIRGNETIYYAALFLVFLAVFIVARSVFQDEDKFKAQEKLEEAGEDEKAPAPDFVLRYSRPFFKRYFTPVVQGMKNKKKIRDKYRRKLASAGLTKELTPEDVVAFKLFLIIGFPIVFLAVRAFLEESWPLSAVPVLSVVGYFYPDMWISGKIDKRKVDLIESMPFIVDMLALSVEAGLDFMAAITKVIEKAPPSALTEEFEILLKETKVGASRAEGLRSLSWRTDCLPIASFCATLIAADAVGASIGPILKTLAGELRGKRSAEAEKKGATAATKILFPMLFLIMPAVGLTIMGPMFIQMMMGNQ